MLKRLHLKNFTVFADADFEFVQGLNVLVGTNGTGKSHVLKLGYVIESARYDIYKQFGSEKLADAMTNQIAWVSTLFKALPEVFLSSQLAPLIRWNVQERAQVTADFWSKSSEQLSFNLTPASLQTDQNKSSIGLEAVSATEAAFKPVYIPAKEILTLNWMSPASEQVVIPVERNYLDLLAQLRLLALRKTEVPDAIQSLTDIIGGEIKEEEGRYYLADMSGRQTAISMVAEGLRKFGTLQKLLSNGSLTKQTTLFWDEPEANLNPALLRKLAAILAALARQGFQIILATHSMSLLKEFHILSRQKTDKPLPIRYFGLNAEDGQPTTVVARDDFKFLPDVVALEAELEQADDLEEIFAREDRQFHADSN
ncbi:AAA family ATPase [Hymenobacter convexus]|uniref:AAA family ATPase n=1 Tax=Hymenobacter sp. CA1UV-4 TaxID=3063782 RepID=UPI002712D386|nr:AAA family ATPase [Hymenobacter sp. CA1UV-4]MDO7851319.1 AAA family ATPase [Hymenobacter sp. CA1UV-4]